MPFTQVAVMSGHFELGEIIKNHRDADVGQYFGCFLDMLCCFKKNKKNKNLFMSILFINEENLLSGNQFRRF